MLAECHLDAPGWSRPRTIGGTVRCNAIIQVPHTLEMLEQTEAGEPPGDRTHVETHFRSVEQSPLLHRHPMDRSWVDLEPELVGQPLDHEEQLLLPLCVLLDRHRFPPVDERVLEWRSSPPCSGSVAVLTLHGPREELECRLRLRLLLPLEVDADAR